MVCSNVGTVGQPSRLSAPASADYLLETRLVQLYTSAHGEAPAGLSLVDWIMPGPLIGHSSHTQTPSGRDRILIVRLQKRAAELNTIQLALQTKCQK